jgi:hypothetical protein
VKEIVSVALLGSAAVLVAGLGTASAVTRAAAPDPVIYACKAKKGGAVRIVAKNTRCKSTETRVTWNQRGLTGPPGPPGPSGQPGSASTVYQVRKRATFTGGVALDGPQLPAGSYALDAVIQLQGTERVGCSFDMAGGFGVENDGPANPTMRVISLVDTITLKTATTIKVRCSSFAPGSTAYASIRAIKVGEVKG